VNRLSGKTLGIILILLSLLTLFHWYYAHIVKGMLVPELAIVFGGSIILGALLVTGKLKVR